MPAEFDFNALLDSIVGWLNGVSDFVGTFFGSLRDLEAAPIATASGIAGLGNSFKMVKDQILDLIGKIGG